MAGRRGRRFGRRDGREEVDGKGDRTVKGRNNKEKEMMGGREGCGKGRRKRGK